MTDPTHELTPLTGVPEAARIAPAPSPQTLPGPDVIDGRTTSEAVLFEIRRVIVGQDEMLERVLVALLAGGHLLLEGVPGLAKTLTIKTLADVLDVELPADPVHPGPRARRPRRHPDLPSRPRHASTPSSGRCSATSCSPTRSTAPRPRSSRALLEVMQERQVTIGHESLRGPAAVPRDGDPEPDRVRGHLPAARGPGRPVHDEGRRRLPERRGGGRWSSSGRSARPPVVRPILTADGARRAPGADRRGLRRPADRRLRGRPDRRRPAIPERGRAAERQAVHRLRREPARLDQPRPRRAGPGPRPRPALRGAGATSSTSPATCSAIGSSRASRRSPKR